MITLNNVTKTHFSKQGVFTSVDNVSLQINKGEVVGIVGASGAGKSTLLRLLNGLTAPTSGKVLVNGVNLTTARKQELNKLRHKIGTIFQGYNLLSALTVSENIALLLKVVKYPRDQIANRVSEVLRLVNLYEKKDDYPKTLSGGEKQRVAIARAISNHPEILLCDEITSALDLKTSREIVDVLNKIKRESDLTIVFVSHELEVVSALCPRVVVMDQGMVVEDVSTTTLFRTPRHSASKALVNTLLDYTRFNERLNYLFVYSENVLNEPLLSKAIATYAIEPSILYAKSLQIHGELFGFMIMRFNSALRMPVKAYLAANDIYIKELGN